MFSFDGLSLGDLARLCAQVTQVTSGAISMEDGAARLTRLLRSAFVDRATGKSEIVLTRLFHTATYDQLPAEQQTLAAGPADAHPAPALPYLCLLGSDGDLPLWRDRTETSRHQVIPLVEPDARAWPPLVAGMVERLDVDLLTLRRGGSGTEEPDDFEILYVADATGSPHLPDHDLVREHGIVSALGFGGLLPGGDVFFVTVFTRTPIPRYVARMFRTVAVAARLALLPLTVAPLFRNQPNRPTDPLVLASSRVRALEQMLQVQQDTVITQAGHLEAAYEEALAASHLAERAAEATELLRGISTMLSAELDMDRLVQAATDAATRLTGAAFGAFFYNVVGANGATSMRFTLTGAPREVFTALGTPRSTEVFDASFTRIGLIRSDDITKHPRYGHNPPHTGIPAGHPPVVSYLAVPVVSRNGYVHGGFFFGHPEPGVFDERAERLAVGIAAQTAVALDNSRLYETERSTAMTLQRSLLPTDVAVPDGIEVGYQYLAGGGGVDVGGDWFDVIPLPGGRTGFVIGDVMGRGVPAAAVMGQLRTAIRAYTIIDLAPSELMARLNQLVCELPEEIIATCVYAIHDQTSDTVTMASAGHLPPLLVDPDGTVRTLELSLGPPLGVPGAHHSEHHLDFPVGARLLLYTDGLVENHSRPLDVGLHELADQLRTLGPRSDPDTLCKGLLDAMLGTGEQDDDVTMLMIGNTGLNRHDFVFRQFDPHGDQAVVARTFVASTLQTWGDQESNEAVVLAVNEMFVNAVRHAGTSITLRLRRLPTVIVAEVVDLDARPPRVVPAQETDENHRGLEIVSAIASRWGSRPTRSGKVVWAEFSVAAQARGHTG